MTNNLIFTCEEILVPLHQQKKGIYRKGQERIGRASHGCFSIVIEGQHPRCLWRSLFVPKTFVNY